MDSNKTESILCFRFLKIYIIYLFLIKNYIVNFLGLYKCNATIFLFFIFLSYDTFE